MNDDLLEWGIKFDADGKQILWIGEEPTDVEDVAEISLDDIADLLESGISKEDSHD